MTETATTPATGETLEDLLAKQQEINKKVIEARKLTQTQMQSESLVHLRALKKLVVDNVPTAHRLPLVRQIMDLGGSLGLTTEQMLDA